MSQRSGRALKGYEQNHSVPAEVAKLADAQASGVCVRKDVQVQVLSSAGRFLM
jgi:hypothetical protein